MIFVTGIVPDSFGVGLVHPILKKGKPADQCASYRPITVSTTFCKLFESLIFDEIALRCTTPDDQFGFKKHSGREHVHSVLANLLIDADKNGDLLVFGALDVSRAFDSGIHGHILLKALQRGVSSCILSPVYSMYNKLSAVILIPSPSGTFPSKEMLSVKKGVRQGGKTSPSLFNNAIIEAQQVIKPSCFFRGINLSLLNFADDILHVSRSISLFQQNYDSLAAAYKQIGLSFNESKTELLFFNGSKNELSINLSVKIGDTLIKPCESLTYLGLPISSTLKDTRSALTNHLCSRLRASYGLLVANKYRFNRPLLARLYNAFTTPHLLALVPFWKIFTATEKKAICSAFYRYAKFLLRLPLWHSNGDISRKYKVTNPSMAIERRISKFSTNVLRANHPWTSVIL